MKKLIQICSILSLLVVFTAISAHAQAVSSYKAEIPFNFNIGQESYEAGSYVIKTTKIAANTVSLSLEDQKGNKLQTILVAAKADVSTKQPELVFNRYEDQRYLTELQTQDAIISVAKSSDEKRSAKKMREKNSNVEVAVVKAN